MVILKSTRYSCVAEKLLICEVDSKKLTES